MYPPTSGIRSDGRWHAGRAVADPERHDQRVEDRDGADGQEGGRPAGVVEQERQRDGRGEVADVADGRGERHQQRVLAAREVGRDQAQHADERERVAEAEYPAGEQGQAVGVGDAEQDLAGAEHQHRDGEHAAGAVAVDEDAGRDLHRGVDADLQHGEGAERGRADAEALGRLQPGDAEGGAVEDREEVDGDGGEPSPKQRRNIAVTPVALATWFYVNLFHIRERR
jgi:hypothetical protein